ncbi:uncharacterized protein LOC144908746 [Branchiostoma floridae x Branchiostoma belcheri]
MFFSVLLIIAASSTVCGTADPLDSVPLASRNAGQHGAQQAAAGNASQLAESGSNSVASPSETTDVMVAASLQSVLEGLQAEMQHLRNETAAKDQLMQAEIGRLQDEMAEKDLRIQDLEQRDYIERCESGVLETPADVFTSGSGSRHVDVTATFGRPFRTTPVVTVGLWYLDNYPGHIRVSAGVTSVSTTSLTVRIGTWADSRLFNARVHWMACA